MSEAAAHFDFITAFLRERAVRTGQAQPRTETERRWAAEGPRLECEYDTVVQQ